MDDPRIEQAEVLMAEYAERTGLTGARPPRRYLWTDAFAVCNFLGLARKTGDARYPTLAAELVRQVHHILGRHRPDDHRSGWISGLDPDRGEAHPTVGGLRIGKPEPERGPREPLDERREWDRDGQYFHYLTKWIVALDRFGRASGHRDARTWARELADTAHRRFVFGPPKTHHMYWKMSIDLERPLVASMGQHDPLDGFVTCLELDALEDHERRISGPSLEAATADFAALIDAGGIATADPLGLGGLLVDAHRLVRLRRTAPRAASAELIGAILTAAARGLEHYAESDELDQPAQRRLGFRELGLAIGLAAFADLDRDGLSPQARTACANLDLYAQLRARIETFWLHPAHRATRTWTEHADINDVMLATSLVPEGFLAPASTLA